MIRRPPRSTRTDTLLPYTTLFRSQDDQCQNAHAHASLGDRRSPCRSLSVRDRLSDPYDRSEEHTSELQSLMRTSYAVFCLKKQTTHHQQRKIGRQPVSTPATKAHRIYYILLEQNENNHEPTD